MVFGNLVKGKGELEQGVGYLGGRQGSSPRARDICTSSDLRTSDNNLIIAEAFGR